MHAILISSQRRTALTKKGRKKMNGIPYNRAVYFLISARDGTSGGGVGDKSVYRTRTGAIALDDGADVEKVDRAYHAKLQYKRLGGNSSFWAVLLGLQKERRNTHH